MRCISRRPTMNWAPFGRNSSSLRQAVLDGVRILIDDLMGVTGKTITTVALDFGRITINSEVVLYLFGTQG
jgi:signal recognition particle receptor subunit beta